MTRTQRIENDFWNSNEKPSKKVKKIFKKNMIRLKEVKKQ